MQIRTNVHTYGDRTSIPGCRQKDVDPEQAKLCQDAILPLLTY